MELAGFSASLVGRALYVYAKPEESWVPWEYISGTQYTCKLLVRGESTTAVEAENVWTAVFRPTGPRDWSILATIIRGCGGSVLLTFDSGSPKAPESFIAFLDSIVAAGRTLLTRIWIGVGIEIPCIPDAIFFPVVGPTDQGVVFDVIGRLPGRGTHGAWRRPAVADWTSVCVAAAGSGLGIVVSDVDESEWSLFWHKVADSASTVGLKQGLAYTRVGLSIVEKYSA
jgi:hypothetical protein